MSAVAKRIVGPPARGGGASYLSQLQVIRSSSASPPGSAQYWAPSITWQTSTKFPQWLESSNRWSEEAVVQSPYWTDPPIDWTTTFKPPQSPYRVFQAGRTILVFGLSAGANVQWLEPTLARIESLLALDASASFGREVPPSPESAIDAVTFLSKSLRPNAAAPSLAPLNDGGVQAEWHRGGLDVEIVFSVDEDERGIYIRDKQTGEEQELPLDVAAFEAAVGDALNIAA